ncbi:nuclease [Cereibacter changlensis JA139]|uniref:Nuclease n=2 Tax=Cereibacter changlensis TaxID=402884 RepID=A0A2T4JY89_9RHOB|nr:thermonuclease family protein [Cereibacter changlensis]PTE22892.1 nuclease [Cereibacter changlensis JA139]PZX55282.1 endonuclease YncB(thermonuclease family) [Cereibacter changlensis]
MLIFRSLLVLMLGLAALPSLAASVTGEVRVIDGDTLHVAGQRVRLFGIDAPERDQSCGAEGARWDCGSWATAELAARVEGRRVVCEGAEEDRYGRLLAVCRADGEDINAALVRSGAALAYRRYSGRYVDQEGEAQRSRLGLWSGEMVTPEAHRRGADAPSAAAPTSGCAIKGNVSKNGRIYHLPGSRDYARTRISGPEEGWFCTEAEARAAGFRPIRN